VTGPQAAAENVDRLRILGAEVWQCGPDQSGPGGNRPAPAAALAELGRRQMTNVLFEGGSELLGTIFDQQLVDEAHVFAAPKFLGGVCARSPVGGTGRAAPVAAAQMGQQLELGILQLLLQRRDSGFRNLDLASAEGV
jgi:diaminohydroxyphosphoribosylaminopyrimidine deaminase/5-amino-6-(5-phosphoribosylamino)uracil reductase